MWCVCNFSFVVVGPFGPTTTEIRFFHFRTCCCRGDVQHSAQTYFEKNNGETQKSSFFSSLVNEYFFRTTIFEDWRKMSTNPIDHHHTKWSPYMNWANSTFLSPYLMHACWSNIFVEAKHSKKRNLLPLLVCVITWTGWILSIHFSSTSFLFTCYLAHMKQNKKGKRM